ncbi:hypothetical protein HYH02_014971 [Chlamydomonas schloesseri]|uniref:t-SNARE coiled-coil homology domain-containing protein n=1 Tax=Chlamydomonas schloesseri TaxID=2026947 RepID=A0A835VS46_9CHLO|nr:hypothetical protein HYH02_014971 [Chlamydomonas schloesseri]|eukprot:KAG2425755.1 hypothetical protein HYH02_014971 [Chlamydomonas schloesseri]
MSFQDLAKNGGRELSNYKNQGTKEVESLVFKLANNVAQLRKLVDILGTAKDTVDHRHRIADVNGSIQQLAKAIKEKITTLHDGAGAGPAAGPAAAAGAGSTAAAGAGAGDAQQQQLKAKRLLQDFANILQDYKTLQGEAARREAASLPRQPPPKRAGGSGPRGDGLGAPLLGPDGGVSSSSRGGGGGGAGAPDDVEAAVRLQAQKQAEVAALDDSVRYHEALIEERDAGIAEIQRQIGEVNEMFQDLAVLIADQGEQLQTVDTAIGVVAERVADGQRELTLASRSSRSARNKCLWIALVAAVVVSILLIIILT